jgi:hypothetical protein
MVVPALTDITEGIVDRVNDYFSTRLTDRFTVFFDKGLYMQTMRNVLLNKTNFPLVWLELPEKFTTGNWRIAGEYRMELYVIVLSDSKYTQQEREDNSFTPRLVPIVNQLMTEIKRERWFQFGYGEIKSTIEKLPFWRIGMPNGADQKNMFEQYADVMRIYIPSVPVKKSNNCNASRPYPQLT